MKFKKLTIENFGVYSGSHEFDLRVYPKNGVGKQNVIIVKGPNGSGKSTFFRAISLVLFGRLALGPKVTEKEYTEYLESRFHKKKEQGQYFKVNYASIKLSFDYVESGVLKEITVIRSWNHDSKAVEKLELLIDNKLPNVEAIDYQSWLNDLLPIGHLHILCFDAENMNSLLRAKGDDELKKVLKRLLGLDLVEKLNDDLSYYLRNTGGGNSYDSLKDQVITQQSLIDLINEELREKRSEQLILELREKEILSNLSSYERELSTQGGDYAARRPLIKERIDKLDIEIGELESKIRELSANLLPFALVPSFSKLLDQQLKVELTTQRKTIAHEYFERKCKDLSNNLSKSKVWDKLGINSMVADQIINEIITHLNLSSNDDLTAKTLHKLSETDVLKIQQWIHESSVRIPELALHLTDSLRAKKLEKSRHVEFYNRAPNDDQLDTIIIKIQEAESELTSLKIANKTLSEEIGRIQFRYDQAERKHVLITSKLREIEKEAQKFTIAQRAIIVLEEYSRKLTAEQINSLSEQLVICFNQICDKDSLISKAVINPDTFEVELFDTQGEHMKLDDFSMGESQIYGLALLWALRKISGYDLPLLIDTPIARLDEVHQDNFIHHFIPQVSDQLLLFTTNVEMNDRIESRMKGSISEMYELKYNENLGYTSVINRAQKNVTNISDLNLN